MANNKTGYYEDPVNGDGITRARTLKLIRSWQFSHSIQSLETFNDELGRIEFPCVYILFETKARKVYIGEAKNIYNRLKTHSNAPEEKIKNWDMVLVISDGRPAAQSDFNDNVIRHTIELYLQKLFKANKYHVVAQGQPEKLNPFQKVIVDVLIEELDFFLKRKGLIEKLIETQEQQEVMLDDLQKIITKNGYKIQEFSAYKAIINNSKVFILLVAKKLKVGRLHFEMCLSRHYKMKMVICLCREVKLSCCHSVKLKKLLTIKTLLIETQLIFSLHLKKKKYFCVIKRMK
ncbi:hypothetical protein FJZ31_09185 [Candidatus Poribacteria bacterium]|nr:hypothetical protein [Candidatus Poribacteria bacterium]